MTPVEKDYILTSAGSVVIDVAAQMVGFDPMTLPYIRLAYECGLGEKRIQEMEIIGEDIAGVNFGLSICNYPTTDHSLRD